MFEKRRTNQGGSIVTFVVVGIVLVVVLLGGLYVVNMRGQQARKNQEIATSEAQKTKPATDTAKQPVVSDGSQKNTQTNPDKAVASAANENSESQTLPTSGVEFNIGQLFVVYLLSVSISAYVLSRRRLTRSL